MCAWSRPKVRILRSPVQRNLSLPADRCASSRLPTRCKGRRSRLPQRLFSISPATHPICNAISSLGRRGSKNTSSLLQSQTLSFGCRCISMLFSSSPRVNGMTRVKFHRYMGGEMEQRNLRELTRAIEWCVQNIVVLPKADWLWMVCVFVLLLYLEGENNALSVLWPATFRRTHF